MKALILSVLDTVRDDSDGEHPVRIVMAPRSSRMSPDDMMAVLLAHTSLENNTLINMVTSRVRFCVKWISEAHPPSRRRNVDALRLPTFSLRTNLPCAPPHLPACRQKN